MLLACPVGKSSGKEDKCWEIHGQARSTVLRGFDKSKRADLAKPPGFCTGPFSEVHTSKRLAKSTRCKKRRLLPRKKRFDTLCKSAKIEKAERWQCQKSNRNCQAPEHRKRSDQSVGGDRISSGSFGARTWGTLGSMFGFSARFSTVA